jgi:membrane protease YdiL (CAAX protease family)
MAPLAEELLFRRVMLHRFLVAGRGLSGLVATSLLFAATHEVGQGGMHSLAQWLGLVLLYTGMGMGFGAVYLRTGRLWAAFLAHAACNATAMAAMAFSAG